MEWAVSPEEGIVREDVRDSISRRQAVPPTNVFSATGGANASLGRRPRKQTDKKFKGQRPAQTRLHPQDDHSSVPISCSLSHRRCFIIKIFINIRNWH